MKNLYYKFYESCIPVIGINRGVIYDLPRSALYFLPKDVLKEFIKYSSLGIDKFFMDYKGSVMTIKKYLNYLLKNELIFYFNNPKLYPKIDTSISFNNSLDVLFLEIDNIDFFKENLLTINQINILGFTNLVLISNNSSFDNLISILKNIQNSRIKNINLLIKYEPNIYFQLIRILSEFELLIEITVFNTTVEFNDKSEKMISFTSESLDYLFQKKITNVNDFVINQYAYYESLKYNLYFNRKIYVDNFGNIKHGFSDINNYGNLKNNKLETLAKSKSFNELLLINKNQIKVCKDCEFKYICPDQRIPKKINNSYYHETICNYDPYKNEWK